MKRRNRQNPFSLFSFQDIITGLCGILIFFVLIMLVDFVLRRESPPASPVTSITDESVASDMDALRQEIDMLTADLAKIRETSQKAIAAAGESVSPEVAKKMESEIASEMQKAAELAARVAVLRSRVADARRIEAKMRELEKVRQTLENKLNELKKSNVVTLIPERGVAKMPVYIVCGADGAELLRPLEHGVEKKRFTGINLENDVAAELRQLDPKLYAVVLMIKPSGVELMDGLAARVRRLGFGCGRDPLEEDVQLNFGPQKGGEQ